MTKLDEERLKETSEDWKKDCNRYWGKELKGKYCHWCADWDYLPIDETCKIEFECCSCYKNDQL